MSERQIVDYMLASFAEWTNDDRQSFLDGIRDLIQEGWQPFGSPVYLEKYGNDRFFYQAMVKYEKLTTEE